MQHDSTCDTNTDESNSGEPILEFENVHKTYLLGVEGIPALRGISLKIHRGEFVIVYGTSGGGKTTLLNIIGTIDKPTKGSLRIGDTRISASTKDSDLSSIRLFRLGFVFQTFNLLSAMTARENVEMPMILAGKLSRKEREERALSLLDKFGIKAREGHLPSQLSGGEQQRTTIARAIANNPDILLLDEPTGDLDSLNTMIVMDLLFRLNESEGITMVMVTHDPNLKNLASRVVYMRDGKVFREEYTDPEVRRLEYVKLVSQLNAARIERGLVQTSLDSEEEEVVPQSFTAATEFRTPASYHTSSAQIPVSEEELALSKRKDFNFEEFLRGSVSHLRHVQSHDIVDNAASGSSRSRQLTVATNEGASTSTSAASTPSASAVTTPSNNPDRNLKQDVLIPIS
eukprot:ANDGO_04305.mRNA.1 ABC transporter H family member 2